MGDLYYRDKVYIFESELGKGTFLASCGGHQESSYGKESDSSPEIETPGNVSSPQAQDLVYTEAGTEQTPPEVVGCMGPGCLIHSWAPFSHSWAPFSLQTVQAGGEMLPCELRPQLPTFLFWGPPWFFELTPCHSHGY